MKRALASGWLCVMSVAVATAGHLDVGSGQHYYDTPALGRPFGAEPGRYQILVLAEDLKARPSERITGLAFDCVLHPEGAATFTDVEVLLCRTPRQKLSSSFNDNYGEGGAVSVFKADELTFDSEGRDWRRIVFDRSFEFDGSENLLVEIRHGGNAAGVTMRTTRWAHEPTRTLDGHGQRTSTMGILRNYLNALRLFFEEPEEE